MLPTLNRQIEDGTIRQTEKVSGQTGDRPH